MRGKTRREVRRERSDIGTSVHRYMLARWRHVLPLRPEQPRRASGVCVEQPKLKPEAVCPRRLGYP